MQVVDQSTLRIIRTIGYDSPGELIHYIWNEKGKLASLRISGTTVFSYQEALKRNLF